jgi:phage gp16-like protein
MITKQQIILIHVAQSRVRLNELQYRTLLHNVAGVETCKDLDQAGVEDVMAVFEDMGFQDKEGGNYWREKVRRRGSECGERMRRKIEAMAAETKYPLGALVHRMSNKRTDKVELLYPREAWQLIEALKAIIDRNEQPGGDLFDGPIDLEKAAADCPF